MKFVLYSFGISDEMIINNITVNAVVADGSRGDGNGGNVAGRNQQSATSDPSDVDLSAPSGEAWQPVSSRNVLSGSQCKPAVVG